MSYHIRHSLHVHCEDCGALLELLEREDKHAKKEAEEIGWHYTRKGWICHYCWEDMPR